MARAQVFAAIKSSLNGLSATQIASALELNTEQIRPRISELANKFKLIEDSNRRLKTKFGKNEIVWINKRS